MKNLKYILFLGIAIILSCNKDDDTNFPPGNNCLPGQGLIVSDTRVLGDFQSVVSTVYADIFITQGPTEDVIIEAQENIIDELKTEVVNGELIIELNRCVDILQAIKVHITIPEIRNLTLAGVGDLMAQNDFNLTDLNVTLTGVGDFKLQGTTSTLDITLTGVGEVKAFDLISDICNVVISGKGDAEVSVNNELNVTISGIGTIYYKGNPTITSSITGTGEIINAN